MLKYQNGTISVIWSNTTWNTVTINFPNKYNSIPLVDLKVFTTNNTYFNGWNLYVTELSSEKMTVAYKSNAFNGNYSFYWFAIGK